MTSIVSPAFSASFAHVENTPPGVFFTAMRSAAVLHGRADRVGPADVLAAQVGAQRQVLALLEAELVAQRFGHGERDGDGVARLALDAVRRAADGICSWARRKLQCGLK